ncbi:MAG: metallopeptidase family protein [Chloroflexi bacterium]|nr:metallopeptidase family protein [Chloroflexota bacterium]
MIRLSQREFADLVQQAYRQLPANVRQTLDNVDISVEERPSPEDFDALSEEATLFGLYTGVPLTERAGYEPALPDRIIVFRRPILESCATTEEVVQEIRITLWHEVGHFLGLDEDDLHRLGYG